MEDIINKFDNWALIKLFGGITIVLSAVISFVAMILKDWINSKFEIKNQKDIELLKDNLLQSQKLIENLSTSMSNIYISSNQKIIDSYDKIWNSMINVRKNFPPVAYVVYSAFTKDEFLKIPSIFNSTLKLEYDKLNFVEYMNKETEYLETAQKYRPFVDIKTWNTFYTYQALFGRLYYLLYQIKTNNIKSLWYDDLNFINDILKLSIDEKDLAKLIEDKFNAFTNVYNYLEMQMHNETQNHLLGKKVNEEKLKLSMAISNSRNLNKY